MRGNRQALIRRLALLSLLPLAMAAHMSAQAAPPTPTQTADTSADGKTAPQR